MDDPTSLRRGLGGVDCSEDSHERQRHETGSEDGAWAVEDDLMDDIRDGK